MSLLNWILEGILVVIFVICLVRTVKNGMIKSLFRSFRVILAFVLAFVLNAFFAGLINSYWIGPWMYEKIYAMILPVAEEGIATKQALIDAVPDFLKTILGNFGTSAEAEASQAMQAEDAAQAFSQAISAPVSSALSAILAFVVIFLGTILLSIILGFVLDKVFELPFLRGVNRIGGIIIGVFSGLCWVWSISHLMVFLAGITTGIPYVAENFSLDNSFLLKFFYHINPLQLLFRITY